MLLEEVEKALLEENQVKFDIVDEVTSDDDEVDYVVEMEMAVRMDWEDWEDSKDSKDSRDSKDSTVESLPWQEKMVWSKVSS